MAYQPLLAVLGQILFIQVRAHYTQLNDVKSWYTTLITLFNTIYLFAHCRGCPPRGVMVKAMDYGIVVREIELQSRYYVHFQVNIHGKGINPLILPAMG